MVILSFYYVGSVNIKIARVKDHQKIGNFIKLML